MSFEASRKFFQRSGGGNSVMRFLTTIVLIYAILAPAQAGQKNARSWGELSQEVQPDWTFRVVLPDSTEIEGKHAVLTPEALRQKASPLQRTTGRR
jgi:hypothetical protein